MLMEQGGDAKSKSSQGNCLMIASRMGHSPLVDVFLSKVTWTREELWDAMLEAVRRLHVDIVDRFQKYGLDIHAKKIGGIGLLHAVANDNKHIGATRYLLNKGIDPNSADERGFRPLHLAAYNAGPITVAELLTAGADPNARDMMAATPLFGAIQKCDVESVRHLLTAGGNAQGVVHIGLKHRPLLHIASQEGALATEMAKLLVASGADLHARDETGALAAKWAAQAGHLELLRYFHDLDCDVLSGDDNKHTPLLSACFNGHLDCARFLVGIGADCNTGNEEGHTALVAAVQENHLDIVTLLFEKGATDSDALNCAFRKRNAEAIRIVLPRHLRMFGDIYGQIKDYSETAISENNYPLAKGLVRGVTDIRTLTESNRNGLLLMAATHGDVDLGRRLIEANPSRSHREKVSFMTPIHCAAEAGHVELVGMLADAGFMATSETQFGQSALHLAAKNGHTAVIERLGGVVSSKVKDINGYCPIHWAAIEGYSTCVRALIDLGSYVDPLDRNQRTLLQWAVESGHVDWVRTLLECGCDYRVVDLRRRMCLHLASLHDRFEVLQLLLPRLVNMVDLRDSLGFTALQYATSLPVTKLLRHHGASLFGNVSLGMSGLEVFALRGKVYVVEELLSQSPHLRHSKNLITKLFMISREEPDDKAFNYLLGLQPGIELLGDTQLISLLVECIVGSDEYRILALLRAIFSLGKKPPMGTAEHLLAIACKCGFLETVRLLAEIPGVLDLGVRGWPPLLVACKHGHLEVVESLLESGAHPSTLDPSNTQTAVQVATMAEHKKIVESLEEYIRFQSFMPSRSLRIKERRC